MRIKHKIVIPDKMARRRLDEDEIQHELADLPSDSESDDDWQEESEEILDEDCEGRHFTSEDGSSDDGVEEDEEDEEVERENDLPNSDSGKIYWKKVWKPTPPGKFASPTGPSQEILDLEDPTPYDIYILNSFLKK